jgi:polysaccharide biosynthesis/export protein
MDGAGLGFDPSADSLAMSVGSEYVMGPDDLLNIRVFGAPELSGEARVSSGGDLSLPLLGPVPATGLTTRELEEDVEDRLRDSYMWDPRVSVQVLEARSHAVSVIYVVGDVRSPGGFPLNRGEPVSVLQAIALAEGLQPTAAKGRARIIRREGGNGRDRQEVAIDLDDLLDGRAVDPPLRPGDILFVPNSRSKSVVRGAWDAFIRVFSFRGLFF